MRAKAFAAIVAATAIAALLLPAVAAAGDPPSAHRHDRLVQASLSLPGSSGYLLGLSLTNHRRLKITALPEREQLLEHIFELAGTEYSLDAQQPRGSDGIKASLGRFGRINLRFVPEEEDEQPAAPLGCKGDTATIKVGTFIGLLAFRGEHGYTRARVHKVAGTVTTVPSPTKKCPDDAGRKPHQRSPHQRARAALTEMARRAAHPEAHLLALRVGATVGNQRVSFRAERVSGSEKGKEVAFDTFIGTASRDLGPIHEVGTATDLLASGPYFRVPDLVHLTAEAVLAPPKPFLGSATYHRESADKVSWEGDLRMKLPGFGAVPLAGPKFKAAICLDSGCESHGGSAG